jgi:hypothetical protein
MQPAFCESSWDIVARHVKTLLGRLNGDSELSLIQVADSFATDALAQRIDAAITPLLGTLRGGRLQLEQTIECILENAALLSRFKDESKCKLSK